MVQSAYGLHLIADYVGAGSLKDVIAKPDVCDAYRVTVQRRSDHTHDTVATLTRTVNRRINLAVYHRDAFNHKPIAYTIPDVRFEAFVKALTALRFDKMTDQPEPRYFNQDTWLIERAAAGFVKSVLLTPAEAEGNYAALVALIKTHLPEALRAVE